VLTAEQNRTLTQIGPGTPMGDLFRRYWQPIAAESEFGSISVRPVRLLGEDLVLYKDGSGTFGLIERLCAHRLTDLAYGIAEDYGLRCPLHGWLYNEGGACLSMPLEPQPYLDEVRLTSYPVRAAAGLIWAYLGPQPAPLLLQWEPFTWTDGLVQIVFVVLDCNWLQCQENAMDPFGEAWLRHTSEGSPSPNPEVPRFVHEEFQYGFHNLADTGDAGPAAGADPGLNPAASGQTYLWPNAVFSGDSRSCRFEWRVPMEDERTLEVAWFFDRMAPGHQLPAGKRFYHWFGRLKEDDAASGAPYLTTHVLNRKFKLWLTQYRTLDRTKENLVESSDGGVLLLRDKYFSQLNVLADGGEPKAVLRSGIEPASIALPLAAEVAPARRDREFPHIAGQPADVEDVYQQVVASWGEPAGPA
jgi:5,5'-dehydrodivanillate O-demethylase